MPAGRHLLRLVRPVGRHHATYSRVGKAVRPLSRRKEAKGPVGPAAEPKERRETSETREAREPSEPRETRETRETSDARDSKDPAPEDAAVEATQESSETSRPQEEPPEPNESKDERSPESSRSGPMDAVLYMRGPAIEPPSANRTHPPMPFTHYFDTYQMVNRLTDAKFQRGQAVTTMKAVRSLLGGKMEEAQKTLVSKGDVDNETYLFKAACSELSTEVRNNRRATDETMREQRMRLQHDTDVLWQTLNHELLTLNDTVRGLFDDRKMAVREEQKANAGSIQKINYKIGTMLSGDAKSEVEGLRWVLIRRSALGIAFMAVASLATLRYAAYVNQQRKEEAKAEAAREKAEAEEEKRKSLEDGVS